MRINAVFEGGGMKGIALAGAVNAAQERGYEFHHVAGTSSGSIVAACLAAGYTGAELKQLILATPFHTFLKRNWFFETKYIGPIIRLLFKKGMYPGEALEQWVRDVLAAKGVRTFGDLAQGQLRIIASDITQGKLLVLPEDIRDYGIDPMKFSVAKAVRMSCSIPFFFDPVMIRKSLGSTHASKTLQNQSVYIVDGGLLSNFPLWLFDQENTKLNFSPTIGFQLVGKNEISVNPIKGPISMLQALFSTMMSAHDERYIEKHNLFRTVKIPTLGVQTTDFDIAPAKSEELFLAGHAAADYFFNSWSKAAYLVDYERFVLRKT
ncbi:patatin-like phospholipase family protein [Paenibacillus sp. N1-5-1-14]|uniref:patatin-like phospholipase family protein n=1 Tax=Paenibacillus radicibacter TaxID=2972488 RepID=UPI0021599970|nr:patatin-like phospholipase family protein [Paenibacillus radicibacter]MCR8642438.1 patatin-like phospholipase family protein [Paenibacillus radicibacter]